MYGDYSIKYRTVPSRLHGGAPTICQIRGAAVGSTVRESAIADIIGNRVQYSTVPYLLLPTFT